ncbi:MAG: class I SAM-dependent methyltransferase, partial [Acidimicrobiales bacterium]|nr:class I SAM-dependent methyltransferase [Acidimicrobiales bacterium]
METLNKTDGPTCRFSGIELKHTFADLGRQPLSNSYLHPSKLSHAEPHYPLYAWVSEDNFLVQLEQFETADEIFSDYAYFSSFSDGWLRHAEAYTSLMVERFGLSAESFVMEVASNDGYLLQYFTQRGIPVLGVEPAANVAEVAIGKGVPSEVVFMGEASAKELMQRYPGADILAANNVLAHVPDLNDFIIGLRTCLAPDGVLTIEFPHLMKLIQETQFDTIYHEHFSYFSFYTVQRIFAHHGITLFDVEQLPTHGGSLRIYGKHAASTAHPVTGRVQSLLDEEVAAGLTDMATYTNFNEKVKKLKRNALGFLLAAKEEGKSIAAYGAPAKGNTMLNYCGIRTDIIDYTVDRSPHKQGLFLPGTQIPIFGPDHVAQTKPDYLLILPWNIKDEV